ncbi:WbqC family protein [Vibrio aestuarianus]|uniref:WbqC family protein n=1 Tax=Vibrio aestuarianus TaxID=28171 RepID=A0AAX3U1A8_9VIBR|nr:WbqC family protein [Vibrio aestuarianus]WGK81284.1 WbqC family protein [Vibrio aestuarianus]
MQPYFFPYIGYFQLIHEADVFVLFDDVKYIHRGWINRNRVLKQKAGWHYIGVPLEKHSSHSLIRDINIHSEMEWKRKIILQLAHYKKIAPYYYKTIKFIETTLESFRGNSMVELNYHIIVSIMGYLEIKTELLISSKCEFDYTDVAGPGDWALSITKQLSGTQYINPIAGRNLFNSEKYYNSGVDLKFISEECSGYDQKRDFEPSLSIIDVLMFNDKEKIVQLITEYKIEGDS